MKPILFLLPVLFLSGCSSYSVIPDVFPSEQSGKYVAEATMVYQRRSKDRGYIHQGASVFNPATGTMMCAGTPRDFVTGKINLPPHDPEDLSSLIFEVAPESATSPDVFKVNYRYWDHDGKLRVDETEKVSVSEGRIGR